MRVCVYSGQVRAMRTRGLVFLPPVWLGKESARPGQVRSDSVIGKGGAESREASAEARLARKRAMMKQGNWRQWDVHMHMHVHCTYMDVQVRACEQACEYARERGRVGHGWAGGRGGWDGLQGTDGDSQRNERETGRRRCSLVTRSITHRPVTATYLGTLRLCW